METSHISYIEIARAMNNPQWSLILHRSLTTHPILNLNPQHLIPKRWTWTGMGSLKLVPTKIQFGRGAKRGGFSSQNREVGTATDSQGEVELLRKWSPLDHDELHEEMILVLSFPRNRPIAKRSSFFGFPFVGFMKHRYACDHPIVVPVKWRAGSIVSDCDLVPTLYYLSVLPLYFINVVPCSGLLCFWDQPYGNLC